MAVAASVSFAAEKTLVFCSEGSPGGFNPSLHSAGTDFDASAQPIYNRLAEFEPGTTKVVPGLAEYVAYTLLVLPGEAFRNAPQVVVEVIVVVPGHADRHCCTKTLPGRKEVTQRIVGAVQAAVVHPVLHGDIAAQQHGRRFASANESPLFLIAKSPPVRTRAESYADSSRTRFARPRSDGGVCRDVNGFSVVEVFSIHGLGL